MLGLPAPPRCARGLSAPADAASASRKDPEWRQGLTGRTRQPHSRLGSRGAQCVDVWTVVTLSGHSAPLTDVWMLCTALSAVCGSSVWATSQRRGSSVAASAAWPDTPSDPLVHARPGPPLTPVGVTGAWFVIVPLAGSPALLILSLVWMGPVGPVGPVTCWLLPWAADLRQPDARALGSGALPPRPLPCPPSSWGRPDPQAPPTSWCKGTRRGGRREPRTGRTGPSRVGLDRKVQRGPRLL